MIKEYEMTEADLKEILSACRPVPYMVFGGMAPRSPQENANDAWCALGKRMGFDGMTVEPTRKGDRIFGDTDSLALLHLEAAERAELHRGEGI